ncbi:MAG: DNA mismatch repair protein MutL, partial [Bacteroidaceae bacterium]|nr:DNA mismatch repair protein MutL [Bacteroidaceae bacterium]
KDNQQGADSDIKHKLALSMARQTSIVNGQVLSVQEMDTLINDLFASSNPSLTPLGQNIFFILSQEDIDSHF